MASNEMEWEHKLRVDEDLIAYIQCAIPEIVESLLRYLI